MVAKSITLWLRLGATKLIVNANAQPLHNFAAIQKQPMKDGGIPVQFAAVCAWVFRQRASIWSIQRFARTHLFRSTLFQRSQTYTTSNWAIAGRECWGKWYPHCAWGMRTILVLMIVTGVQSFIEGPGKWSERGFVQYRTWVDLRPRCKRRWTESSRANDQISYPIHISWVVGSPGRRWRCDRREWQ